MKWDHVKRDAIFIVYGRSNFEYGTDVVGWKNIGEGKSRDKGWGKPKRGSSEWGETVPRTTTRACRMPLRSVRPGRSRETRPSSVLRTRTSHTHVVSLALVRARRIRIPRQFPICGACLYIRIYV